MKINSSTSKAYLYLGNTTNSCRPAGKESAYILFYRWEQAGQHFDQAYSLDPSLMPARVGKALSESMAGQRDAAPFFARQEDEMEARGVADSEFKYKMAQAYAVLGDKSAARHMLQHTVEGGFFCYLCFLSDPLLESIRSAPEFQRLTGEARQRHEQFKTKVF